MGNSEAGIGVNSVLSLQANGEFIIEINTVAVDFWCRHAATQEKGDWHGRYATGCEQKALLG
jgi:hypothetical protein